MKEENGGSLSKGRYPVAVQALVRLLAEHGLAEDLPAPSEALKNSQASKRARPPSAAGKPFVVGAAVLRPPAQIQRPAPHPKNATQTTDAADADALADVASEVLVSEDGDEVQLVFHSDTRGGLRLVLQQRSDGLHGRFLMSKDVAQEGWRDQIEALLQRLKDKGVILASHSTEVVRGDGSHPR